MMGKSDKNSNVDKITFTTLNSFSGLYGALDETNMLIKTLGAYVDLCEI
jgi:hypothetical protein